jgi:hypothetical protein
MTETEDEAIINSPEADRLWSEISKAADAYSAYCRIHGVACKVNIDAAIGDKFDNDMTVELIIAIECLFEAADGLRNRLTLEQKKLLMSAAQSCYDVLEYRGCKPDEVNAHLDEVREERGAMPLQARRVMREAGNKFLDTHS